MNKYKIRFNNRSLQVPHHCQIPVIPGDGIGPEIWKSTNYGFDQIHIENPTEQDRKVGWYYYIMKDFDENSIDWVNTTIQ